MKNKNQIIDDLGNVLEELRFGRINDHMRNNLCIHAWVLIDILGDAVPDDYLLEFQELNS